MSEADSPNDQPAPAATEPSEQVAAFHSDHTERLHPTPDDGWQTVDFPGAMSVDALPQMHTEPLDTSIAPGIIHYSNAEIDLTMPYMAAIPSETSGAVTPLQQLQDENAALRDRLMHVEQDLVQQIEQQLEAACTPSQAEIAIDAAGTSPVPLLEQPQVLQPTRDRLQQLVQALERSHQTAQRQQILVETLTEQLKSSQERIAQLERDCALTQQRYNEQVQQVLEAESACRDLRLRLHRQQQQTLQFKAALEKCLEMPTIYSNQALPDVALEGMTPPDELSASLKSTNQPVKPWSLPQTKSDSMELPKTLFNLVNHGILEQDDAIDLLQGNAAVVEGLGSATADPSALLDSDDPQFVTHLMQLIFPATAELRPYTAIDALQTGDSQAEAVLGLSPVLEESTYTDPMPPVDDASPTPASPDRPTKVLKAIETMRPVQIEGVLSDAAIASSPVASPSDDRSTDPLWRDLATLIDLPQSATTTIAAVDTDSLETPIKSVQAVAEQSGIPPMFTAPHAPTPAVEAPDESVDPAAPPLTTWTWRDRLINPNKAPQAPTVKRAAAERTPQTPSKLLALSAGSHQSPIKQQTISISSQADLTATPFATVTPSPIVYPLRSTRKLASLAAVDLPTFPRR